MCEGKFFLACRNQRCFACLISNKFETKRQWCEALQSCEAQLFSFCEALAYAKHSFWCERQLLSKNCIDVETQWFCMFSHVCMFSWFCIGLMWTGLDRSLFSFATFWIQNASQNTAWRTKDVRFQNSLTRPTQQLRTLRNPWNGWTAALDSCVCVCEGWNSFSN